MKQKQDSNTEQGNRANTLLYAVAPTPKLSTDAIALDSAVVSRGNGIGATSKDFTRICDTCRNFEVTPDSTREICHAKKQGSNVIIWMTDLYADERMSGDKLNCKGYEKI